MARITLATQAAAHDIAIKALKAQLEVANQTCANLRTTIANRDRTIDDLAACIEARDATLAAQATRLDNAVAYFKAQRTTPVVVAPQPKVAPVPTRSCYHDAAGQLWERTRYSATRSVSRMVDEASPAETFADADAA